MEFVTISRSFNLSEADMLVARLRAAGFDVLLLGGDAGRMTASMMSVGGVRIQVPANQKEDVEKFLKVYDNEDLSNLSQNEEVGDDRTGQENKLKSGADDGPTA
jgi:NADH:ubiquinone oxidoreductase subunit D